MMHDSVAGRTPAVRSMVCVLIAGIPFAAFGAGCEARRTQRPEVEHANVAIDASPRQNDEIVFSSAHGDLYLFNTATGQVQPVTQTTDKVESWPAFSPDGLHLVYSAQPIGAHGAHLEYRSLNGAEKERTITSGDYHDAYPSFARDGKSVVFARAHLRRRYSMGGWKWDQWDAYSVKIDGTGLRRLTRQAYDTLYSPRYGVHTPDVIYSAYVATPKNDQQNSWFSHTPNHTINTFLVPADGTKDPLPLFGEPTGRSRTRGGAWATEPDFAPDGSNIVFITDRTKEYRYDICISDKIGSHPVREFGVTSVASYNRYPVFTSDSKSVLFLAGTDHNAGARALYSLWRVSTKTRRAEKVADSGLFTDPLQWNKSPNQ